VGPLNTSPDRESQNNKLATQELRKPKVEGLTEEKDPSDAQGLTAFQIEHRSENRSRLVQNQTGGKKERTLSHIVAPTLSKKRGRGKRNIEKRDRRFGYTLT